MTQRRPEEGAYSAMLAEVQAMCEIHSNMMGMRHMYMCTMLAHTCVVVVHVFMFIGSKSAPLPSCGSIVLQNDL